jgi:hypothetical protein
VWEHAWEGRRRLHGWEANLANVVRLCEPKDAPDLIHGHTALDVDDGAVEGSTHILKVTKNEGLVHIKATSNDVLAILKLQQHADNSRTAQAQLRYLAGAAFGPAQDALAQMTLKLSLHCVLGAVVRLNETTPGCLAPLLVRPACKTLLPCSPIDAASYVQTFSAIASWLLHARQHIPCLD